VWANSLEIRIPHLQLNDKMTAGGQVGRAFVKEDIETVIQVLEVYPFDDAQSQDHIIWTRKAPISRRDPVCRVELDSRPLSRWGSSAAPGFDAVAVGQDSGDGKVVNVALRTCRRLGLAEPRSTQCDELLSLGDELGVNVDARDGGCIKVKGCEGSIIIQRPSNR
jgi:hypothetical protein